jgi:hypothetical protein
VRLIATGLFGGPSEGLSRHYTNKVLDTQPANLIAYWPLNGNANDSSGNGFNGTASANVTWGDGLIPGEQAAVFAGNAYINLLAPGLSDVFNGAEGTLAGFAKVSAEADWADAAWRSVVDISVGVDGLNTIGVAKRSTVNSFYYGYTAGAVVESRNETIGPSADLFHWAITWSKTLEQVIYYRGGVALETDTVLGTWAGTITRFLLGAQTTALSQPWKGSICHVPLWDTPLSAEQIASLADITPPF